MCQLLTPWQEESISSCLIMLLPCGIGLQSCSLGHGILTTRWMYGGRKRKNEEILANIFLKNINCVTSPQHSHTLISLFNSFIRKTALWGLMKVELHSLNVFSLDCVSTPPVTQRENSNSKLEVLGSFARVFTYTNSKHSLDNQRAAEGFEKEPKA